MTKRVLAGIVCLAILPWLGGACRKSSPGLYTFGIFQITDAPTLNAARRGFIQALSDRGLRDGVNVRLVVRNAMGDLAEARRIAREFVDQGMDMVVALSTQCLQAAIMAGPRAPVVFASVANPHLLGVGSPMEGQGGPITGVASTAPIKQTLAFIREVLPQAGKIGTVWTPAELNSEYYLQVLREGALELGFEVISVPVANFNEVLLSGQKLLNRKVDLIFPISDNTINASFESLGRLANENSVPLFGGFPLSTRQGACAAMGWDFFEMGHKAGEIAARIKNGEDPGRIPIQSMSRVRLHLNLAAAKQQGVEFPPGVIGRADEILGQPGTSGQANDPRSDASQFRAEKTPAALFPSARLWGGPTS
jgi:putative ABC transport system substrate-binding protein